MISKINNGILCNIFEATMDNKASKFSTKDIYPMRYMPSYSGYELLSESI